MPEELILIPASFSDTDQLSFLLVVSAGVMTGFRVRDFPPAMMPPSRVRFFMRLTTVSLKEAFSPEPSLAVAVMVTVPAFRQVILPPASMAATLALEDFQVTSFPAATG